MKRILLLSFLSAIAIGSFAQITITKNDMPAARDTARYSTSSTQLNFDTTGAGITWDYSALVADGQNIDSFEPALSINPAYALYFGFTTDYGVPATNLNLGVASLTNTYDFYKTSSSDLQINGVGAEYTGIPLASNYNTPDKVYQFPLTYGRIDTSTYDVTISVPATATVHEIGTRINTVDGWGTVITPFDTFQCIRLKSVVTETDSITITLLGFTIPTTTTTTTYKWLANGVIIPVLEVSGNVNPFSNTFQATSEKFRDGVRFIPPQFNLTINFTANLTTCTTLDTVTITPRVRPFNAINTTSYDYTISPGTFNYVNATDSTSSTPQVNFTAPGLYTVSLFASSPAGGSVPATADTTKPNYILVNYPAGISNVSLTNNVLAYPNPADNHISCLINTSANKQTSIELVDITGKVVYAMTSSQSGIVNIPTDQIPEGAYLLRVTPAGAPAGVQKITILH